MNIKDDHSCVRSLKKKHHYRRSLMYDHRNQQDPKDHLLASEAGRKITLTAETRRTISLLDIPPEKTYTSLGKSVKSRK